MDWLAFAGSILGGVIGGLFTFLGVRLTLKHELNKESREILRTAIEEMPRLEVIDYLDFEKTKNVKTINKDCNVIALKITKFEEDDDILRFYYDENALKSKGLVFVEYTFMNTGKTEINDICITSNLPKIMSVVDYDRKDIYIKEKILNYEVWANKRYIKSGQEIKIRVYYIKDQVIEPMISNPLTLWLHDINGRYWEQSFRCPSNIIEISRLSSREKFIINTDVDKAMECFKYPYLW